MWRNCSPVAKTGAEGLGRRLLGGEAPGQEVDGSSGVGKFRQFVIGEDTAYEPIPEPLKDRLYAGHPDDVRADAVDQRRRASTMSRFISRTAACIPQNSARAMIA